MIYNQEQMTTKQYTFDAKLIYNIKQEKMPTKQYVLNTRVIEITKEEQLVAIVKGEIAVEITKKSKQKSSTNTMSSGIKKIKPQIKKSWYHSNTS